MGTSQMSRFLRRLTRGMAAETLGELTDRQLLERLLSAPDEAVFEALLRRHGPMVYRVCWRVLQQAEDVEDAFQATFLVLARKLPTVRKQDSLASWLHGVAHRIALDATAQAAKRRRHEARAAANSHQGPPQGITWSELRTVLDSELGRLPEKWRLPLILCYLEGRSQEEAAGQLGWSKSTLLRRLKEARAALGRRLTRRGVVWPAALSAVLLSDCVAPAALAPGLVGSTVEAAACIVAGQAALTAAVSAKVAALTEGVSKTMLLTKVKVALAALLVAGLLVASVSAISRPALAERPEQNQEKDKPPDKHTDKPEASGWREMVTMKHEHAITALARSADWSVAGDEGGNLFAWDTRTGKDRTHVVKAGFKQVDRLQFTADEKDLYAPDGKSLYVIWGGRKGISRFFVKDKKFEGGHGEGVGDDGGGYLGVSADAELSLELFREGKGVDLRRNAYVFRMGRFEFRPGFDLNHHETVEYKAKVSHALVSAGEKWLAVATEDGTLHIHDRASLRETHTIAAGKEGVAITDVQFSADGKRIAVAGDSGLAKVYDTAKGEEVATLKGHSGIVFTIAFSPDGKKIVTGGDDNIARVWDAATGKALATLKGHTDSVRCAAFDPSGEILVTGSADKTVKIWSAK
jgi:RNA polymerase sigma factor (sigma-70 family)